MTEVKGVERRRKQLLDDLRTRRRYWQLKEKTEDRKRWIEHQAENTNYIPQVHGPPDKQHA